MIKHKKLLIDQDCPMCQAYGAAFTKFSLIDPGTVTPYQTAPQKYTSEIDMHRAKDEIALYCTKTHESKYGIDAMIEIVSQDEGKFRKFLLAIPVYNALKVLYRFISYNRKVIAPKVSSQSLRICYPTVNPGYNWAFILLSALITGYILNHFSLQVNTAFTLEHDPRREYLICFGQVVWQSIAILTINRHKYLSYLGNMSTVSLIGGLLLAPALLIYHALGLPIAYLLIAFAMIICIMFIEHLRRCRLLGLPVSMTVSWITYRVVIFAIIITLNL